MVSVYFAQKAFIVHDGCLLAVRRSAGDRHNPLCWEVPGGRLEKGETLEQHLVREVREEVGITVSAGEPFYIWKWGIKPGGAGEPEMVVAVARLCGAETTALDASGRVADDGLDLMEWVPLAKLSEYRWIPNMLPVIEAFRVRISSRISG